MSKDNFALYAQYYDLLYKDKNYAEEAEYVHQLIKAYKPSANALLNLGCGTGKHDFALAELGYTITGVDLSEEMVSQARRNSPPSSKDRLNFLTADVRTLDIKKIFDVVISLFHVISYQVENRDIIAMIDTAYKHLPQQGLFVFDCWYGPGVLTDPPVVRIKRLSSDTLNIMRLAEPVLNPLKSTVDVNYTILITETGTGQITEIKETHVMRYLFVNEIELIIENKFRLLQVNEWLSRNQPGLNTWNAVFVLQKI